MRTPTVQPALLALVLLLLGLTAAAHAADSPWAPADRHPIMARAGSNLPTPFDTTVGNNFTTQACQTWFNGFIKDQRLLSCIPISLLLQTSTSFFTASKSLVTLTSVLDASCSVNYQGCSSAMDAFATELAQKANCQGDLRAGNPIVVQAMQGLAAYKATHRAACLKSNSTTSPYCMGQAFTNRSSPTSAYVYYLPLGNTLPGGSIISCTQCLRDTIAGYAVYAGNSSQPLSTTFSPSAQLINLNCGPHFVNTTVPTAGAVSLARPPAIWTMVLGLAVGAMLAL